jgi:hypothetical protein
MKLLVCPHVAFYCGLSAWNRTKKSSFDLFPWPGRDVFCRLFHENQLDDVFFLAFVWLFSFGDKMEASLCLNFPVSECLWQVCLGIALSF